MYLRIFLTLLFICPTNIWKHGAVKVTSQARRENILKNLHRLPEMLKYCVDETHSKSSDSLLPGGQCHWKSPVYAPVPTGLWVTKLWMLLPWEMVGSKLRETHSARNYGNIFFSWNITTPTGYAPQPWNTVAAFHPLVGAQLLAYCWRVWQSHCTYRATLKYETFRNPLLWTDNLKGEMECCGKYN
jgi:hypothetical protein